MPTPHKDWEIFNRKPDYEKDARRASRRCHLDKDICKSLLEDGWYLVEEDWRWSWEKGRE